MAYRIAPDVLGFSIVLYFEYLHIPCWNARLYGGVDRLHWVDCSPLRQAAIGQLLTFDKASRPKAIRQTLPSLILTLLYNVLI